jgi:hypothetical protein
MGSWGQGRHINWRRERASVKEEEREGGGKGVMEEGERV